MSGWKTWVTAIATAAYGGVLIYQGSPDEGLKLVIGAMALVGIGHKLDKVNR